MIKKAEDLTIGDMVVNGSGSTPGRVANMSRGETLIGATVQYPSTGKDEYFLSYLTWERGTEVFVPVPAQPGDDWPDPSTDPKFAGDPRFDPSAPPANDEFIKGHAAQVAEIRSQPGYVPTIFPDELGNDDRNLADWGTNTPLQ